MNSWPFALADAIGPAAKRSFRDTTMATKGYDDGAAIRAVDEILAAEPRTSRRAAIIRVAGEDSLRRIELKMSRRGGEATGKLTLASAGMEWDPLAQRLSAGETALVTGVSERRIWSSYNSRQAIAQRRLAVGHERYATAKRLFPIVDRISVISIPAFVCIMVIGIVSVVLIKQEGPPFVGLGLIGFAMFSGLVAMSLANGIRLAMVIYMDGVTVTVMESVRGLLRRYVLTDRALYVLAPEADGVSWTRTEIGTLLRAEASDAGTVRIVGSGGDVVLQDIVDGSGLIDALAA